jgi:hypothetical protein
MVKVKEKIKVKTGTVVKIDVDDKGMVRVTTGNTPWVDLDEEEEDEENYEALPTYKPTEIVYEGKRYIFRQPLDCQVTWEWDAYFIRYQPFGLIATDFTFEGAIKEFNYKFDSDYQWFNELGETGLGNLLDEARQNMNAQILQILTVN